MTRLFIVLGAILAATISRTADVSWTSADRALDAVVIIVDIAEGVQRPHGTGFFVSADGFLVTADHVIYDEKNSRVHPSLYAKRVVDNRVTYHALSVVTRLRDAGIGRDIAILRISEPERDARFPFLEVTATIHTGQEVVVAGYPLVFDDIKPFPLLRQGLISSTRYLMDDQSIILLDLRAVPGLSGAPVIEKNTGLVVCVLKGDFKTSPDSDFSFGFRIVPEDIAAARRSLAQDGETNGNQPIPSETN